MTEALKCPECSAPLQYPDAGGPTMRCPYCNATVLLPLGAQNQNQSFGTMFQKPDDLAGVAAALRAGNKIEAIRQYRQIFRVDLATAKNAVERYAAQHNIGPTVASLPAGGVNPSQSVGSALKVGVAMTVGILFLMAMILVFVFVAVRRPIVRIATLATPPPMPVPTVKLPRSKSSTPAVSGFARLVQEFGSDGIGAGQFKDSRSITTDNQGHLYVGEYSDGRVQVFDMQGKFISAWSIGQEKSLINMTADRRGNVYVLVPWQILRYEGATGKLLGKIEDVHNDDVHEDYFDVFAALDGDLYAIGNTTTLVDIDPDGHIKRTLNLVEKVGENLAFDKVIVTPTGEIYALCREKGVFKFAPDGRYINRFGGGGGRNQSAGHLSSPRNLAADGKGRIYVTDNNRTVQVFDEDGNYLDSFGGSEVAFGVTISDQNDIYLCLRNKRLIQKYALEKP